MREPWKPIPGPQEMALDSKADILFYGGAAGGGKTDLLIGAALRRHKRSIIFRREYTQLKAIIDRIGEAEPTAKFNKSSMIWTFEDGRVLELGAVQYAGDEKKYQGRPHDLKAFDELAHFGELQFRTLCGWLRSADKTQRCRVLATGNPPTESEGDWILRYFAPWLDTSHPKPAKAGELRWYTTIGGKDEECENGEPFEYEGDTVRPQSRTFIPARVEDNPHYMESGYKTTLQALPEPLRAKMLKGDFTVGRGDNPYQLIPTDWIEAAIKRWTERGTCSDAISCIGVDVARGGNDKTVLTLRRGNWFDMQRSYSGALTTTGDAVAQLVLLARGAYKCKVNVDVIGVGASAFDALRRHIGDDARALNSAKASDGNDSSGQVTFVNKRAQWWWSLRESLDPVNGDNVALPDDRELLADLAAPRFRLTIRGVLVEPKEAIIRRIGRSPDKGDSLVYAHASEPIPASGFMDYYASLAAEVF